ncbi:alpha/beta hydrolase [Anaerobacillus alkalidiazotrophicus]|uniref:Alpha/beta hydrolase n=1 Tax=Anaerobacillus alkalidiazotrophicus TaxID=472963 RepID=A0A1S2M564_9BACI|nr:alpha/beta hydrolase [Anaerobacillus alkalidiazotrophicus]OIJ18400.1 alpha/beta hydrolase [Anaerobacillus alkalidiazotrophicus]OIJ19879.1 alpha/beta hydrolase [Anaerobacillus alkalidiazotrophicus]
MDRNQIKSEFITISNVKIFCEHVINGKPPMLFIHGFASSTYTFNRLFPLIEKHFSIIAIDLPGFGRSEKSTTFVYSFKNYAELIEQCIDYFKLTNVTIVGHSMGGQIALYTAKAVPEKINKLILLGCSGYLKRAKKFLIYASYLPFFNYIIYFYIHKKEVKDYLKNVFYNHSLINDEMISEFRKPLLEKKFYQSLTRLLRYREGDLLSHQLKAIYTPTLLIWGEEDNVVSVNIGKRLVYDLPNAKLITYKETGHLITEERPVEVFEDILSYTS